MKKLLIIAWILTSLQAEVFSQGDLLLGQYFQNLPAFSPAFTGANDFLDIRTGFRKQWAGFEGAPTTGFLSAYSPIRLSKNPYKQNSLRSSSTDEYYSVNDKGYNPAVRLGVGGYLFINDRGPFRAVESMANFATHVPVAKRTFLSLGVSAGILNSQIDLSELTVEDEINDQTYFSIINDGSSNTSLNLNASLGIHSDGFYLGYSTMRLARTVLGGNADLGNVEEGIRHHIMGGFRLFLNNHWELMPNAFLRLDQDQPGFFEVGTRARFKQRFLFGASYRNDVTLVGMLGLTVNEMLNIGYSFEFKNTDFDNFSSGSHEVILGLRLFNYGNYTSIW